MKQIIDGATGQYFVESFNTPTQQNNRRIHYTYTHYTYLYIIPFQTNKINQTFQEIYNV